MPVQTSSNATSGNLTRNETRNMKAALAKRTYDQFATPNQKTFEPRGNTVQRAWIAKLQPRPDAAVGSETTDFDPQTVRDYAKSFTLKYLNDGLKAHDLVMLKNALSPEREFPRLVGELAMEEIDALARRAATEGNLVLYGDSSISARSSLDLGTTGHRMNLDIFTKVRAILGSWMTDDNLFVVMDNFQYADLLNTSGAVITDRMRYAESGKEALYNFELGSLAGVRIIVSPLAKAFYGAASANASAVNTTIASSTSANKAGATTVEVASAINIAAGMWLTLGTIQSSTETDATIITEIVQVSSISGTTVTVVGSGAGGTLKFDHAVGDTVKNNDTAHCAVFGSKESLVVGFDGFGRYGKLVDPFQDGKAKQWTNWAFKYFGNYAILDQSKIIRAETSASQQ